VALSDRIRETMETLADTFPPGVSWAVAYDPTIYVRSSIDSVINTLLEAIVLVVLVVVLFLQTWRASIIPLVAVPVSIIGAFAVLMVATLGLWAVHGPEIFLDVLARGWAACFG